MPSSLPGPDRLSQAHSNHPRTFRDNWYVYPVVSRRSRGISVGINLNPAQDCNFDCVYCQVDRTTPSQIDTVVQERLLQELEGTLDLVVSGELFRDQSFSDLPQPLRRLNDIAFSGDGEPTACPDFAEIAGEVAGIKRRRRLDQVKLILITNATLLHRPRVRKALAILDANQGEIWAKLDAGTPSYYQQVDRSAVPLKRILSNLLEASLVRPIVVQSLFLALDDRGPDDREINAFCDRVREIIDGGGQIKSVQVYTVSRQPADDRSSPLPAAELERIGEWIRTGTKVSVEVFHSGLANN
jgi:wyosine [tRNA(Phe)-imidazoG37] synthetase (radical SAM superfamily)